MRIRTLFNIILKILGLFLIRDILATLTQLFSGISILLLGDNVDDTIFTLVSAIIFLLVFGSVSWVLIFRTEFIIDKFKLDKGFKEESIGMNVHRSTVLSISVIVIGGLTLTDEIPNLCRQLYAYYQARRLTDGQISPSTSYSVLILAKIIVGLLLIGNQRQIVNYIERRRKM